MQYISKHPMYALEFTDCKLTLVIRNTLTYLEVSKCQIWYQSSKWPYSESYRIFWTWVCLTMYIISIYTLCWASVVAQMAESAWDPLEKETATHSSILAWKIPWMEEPSMLYSMGLQRVGHNWTTSLYLMFVFYLKKKKTQFLLFWN